VPVKTKKNTWSFQVRITLFLLIMLVLESVLFVGFLIWGSVLTQFDQNASDIFVEEISNRSTYLKTDMVQRWSQLDWTDSMVEETVEDYLREHHISTTALVPGSADTTALLAELAPDMIATLRRNSVNGVFIVFHGNAKLSIREWDNVSKAGLYLRDTDPTTDSESNSDLFIRCGPYDLTTRLGLAMDINWNPTVIVDRDSEWYYSALRAGVYSPKTAPSQLGYWSPMHALSGDQTPKVVTYTQPLITKSGIPYGVLGIELTEDYLRRQLPYDELPGEKTDSSYILAYADSDNADSYQIMASAGALSTWYLGERDTFHLSADTGRPDLYRVSPVENGPDDKVYSYFRELELYDRNSQFEKEHWYLLGMTRGEKLFAYTTQVRRRAVLLFLLAITSGLAISLWAGRYLSRPINKLSTAIRNQDPNKPVELEPANIREVDELSDTIVTLSREMAESLSRTNQIIDTVNMPIAVFQFNTVLGRLSCSSRFFSILGLPDPGEPLSGEEFKALLEDLHGHIEEDLGDGETLILRLPNERKMGEGRWIRFQRLYHGNYMMGILMDITDSQEKLARTEFERDHDPLTGLSNRLAFRNHLAEVAEREKPGVCAAMMMDLDNLKSINDTYGHDYGDEFIRTAANVLRRFTGERCFPARISGDEFYVLFSGYETRREVEDLITRIRRELMRTQVRLPKGELRRLRASVGVAWYPDDTDQVEELVRYADFAMYQAKHSEKGSLYNFNAMAYDRDSGMVYDNAELDRIIETADVDFIFQPIVSCRDGAVLGYEALMRPRSTVFPSPEEFLQVARLQSKLHHIEYLTWLEGSAAFMALEEKEKGARLFLNSIPSQHLSPEEVEEYNRRYPGLMGQTVLELLESDESNSEYTAAKLRRSEETGMMIALDDFGSGYSNEGLLLNLHPHFVKVDRDVIREIDMDPDRQTVFYNITESCHSMGIQVVAEGVETLEQLRMVVSLGADYVQGFYIRRPAAQPQPIPEKVREEIKAAWKEYRSDERKSSLLKK